MNHDSRSRFALRCLALGLCVICVAGVGCGSQSRERSKGERGANRFLQRASATIADAIAAYNKAGALYAASFAAPGGARIPYNCSADIAVDYPGSVIVTIFNPYTGMQLLIPSNRPLKATEIVPQFFHAGELVSSGAPCQIQDSGQIYVQGQLSEQPPRANVPAPSPEPSASRAIALPDCLGKPVVRPRTVVFACADAGFIASTPSWRDWGGAVAEADGTAQVNDCSPSCAQGRYRRYRIVVRARGRQRCPDGRLAYLRVTYSFIGRSPFPRNSPGATSPQASFPCRPRP